MSGLGYSLSIIYKLSMARDKELSGNETMPFLAFKGKLFISEQGILTNSSHMLFLIISINYK